MAKWRNSGLLLLVLLLSGLWQSCRDRAPEIDAAVVASPEGLTAHSAEFEKQVIAVSENVHVAIGYGLANSIMIEGEDGLIIIDAMATLKEGEAVRQAFGAISDKPVKAIIYTHNHTDHVFGAAAIAGEDEPMVIAQESMPYHLDKIATVIRPIIEKRSYRMFGNYLTPDELVNCGIGPSLGIDEETELGVIRPTLTFKDSLSITIAGIPLELYHAPGETPDQLMVWMPDQQMLFCGDNFYRSFPNLYTIRGTAYRDLNSWKESLDRMRRFPAEHLIPSHTRPLKGKEHIYSTLTDYRDAIQYVHDQTVRYMNLGYTPDEIVEKVVLPPHLASSPYLQEYYGKVVWTVRSVFNGYLGWFDGNSTTLYPSGPSKKAGQMAALAGGYEALKRSMVEAYDSEDDQWVLELTDHLLALQPDDQEVARYRYDALVRLGMRESNPNARHYFLTSAKELKGLKNEALVTPDPEMVHSIPMASVFAGMATFLNADKAAEVNRSVVFTFPDTGEAYTIIVRKGVAEVRPYAIDEPDNTITVDAAVWKEIAAEIRSPLSAIVNGELKIEGGKIAFARLMDLFDR